MRIPDFLTEKHIAFEKLFHPPAFSAQKLAKYLGIPGRQVAKTVLLRGPKGYVLAVLPATHYVDTQALARDLDGPVTLARDNEIAEIFRDCEWGVVTPFGTLYNLPTILDVSLATDSVIVFESHTHAEAIRMRCGDFDRLEHPRHLSFARLIPTPGN